MQSEAEIREERYFSVQQIFFHYFSGQEAFVRNSVNRVFPISLSLIRRRNKYGETLLHRAVAHKDVDLVRNIIKAGGDVNVQDYGGKLQLY